ncbi:MAG: D-aminoacyl-tRNA deacylase [Phycisphaerales bacterium]
MLAVVQRVSSASVSVDASSSPGPASAPDATSVEASTSRATVSSIGAGLCVLLCVEQGDGDDDAAWMAAKLARLRIFSDEAGRMNLALHDVGGAILIVSQFTLAGDCSRGNRPSFVGAAAPAEGRRLYERAAELLARDHGLHVERGVFGAHMTVSLVNEGPVTVIVRSPRPAGGVPMR